VSTTTKQRIRTATLQMHPDFPEWAKKNERLLWKAAIVISQRKGKEWRFTPREAVGTLAIFANRLLWDHDEDKGKFSTRLFRYGTSWFVEKFMRYESESWENYVRRAHDKGHGTLDVEQAEEAFYLYLSDYDHHRSITSDDGDAAPLMGMFDGPEDFWQFCRRQLPGRYADVLEGRFKHGLPLSEVGRQMGVSKQATHEMEKRALAQLKAILDPMRRSLDTYRDNLAVRVEGGA
jgi:hypothetical protein